MTLNFLYGKNILVNHCFLTVQSAWVFVTVPVKVYSFLVCLHYFLMQMLRFIILTERYTQVPQLKEVLFGMHESWSGTCHFSVQIFMFGQWALSPWSLMDVPMHLIFCTFMGPSVCLSFKVWSIFVLISITFKCAQNGLIHCQKLHMMLLRSKAYWAPLAAKHWLGILHIYAADRTPSASYSWK